MLVLHDVLVFGMLQHPYRSSGGCYVICYILLKYQTRATTAALGSCAMYCSQLRLLSDFNAGHTYVALLHSSCHHHSERLGAVL
jgi:hypothetical protein